MPNIGEKQITVSWIDEVRMVALAKKRGATETDGILDYVEFSEVTICRTFPSLALARGWARKNRAKDMYGMPRIEEYTYQRQYDDLGEYSGDGWDSTGYWEVDGDALFQIGA